MWDVIQLLLGVLLAGVGGELFVRGLVGLASWARVPPGIIGATVAAFATTSPEISVAVSASLQDASDMALGGALGSNIVNVGVILAVAAIVAPIRPGSASPLKDVTLPVVGLAAVILLGLDGEISRFDSIVLLGVFATWLGTKVIVARRERSAAEEVLGEPKHGRAVAEGLIGFFLLVGAGILIVQGATGMAARYGWNEFLVGATLVAIGTSTPEFATMLISKLRGHDEVGYGNILGSIVYNTFLIVGLAGVIAPITVARGELALGAGTGILLILLSVPGRAGEIVRARGVALLAVYATYVASVVALAPQ